MVLFMPSMLGGATQNYIIVLLFTALVAHPVTNIGMNSVESVRVIGCSLTMTFDQLRERAKLVLNPILEALSDRNETDLSEIHKYIGRMRENVNMALLSSKSSIKGQQLSDGSGPGVDANLDIDQLRAQLGNKARGILAQASTSKGGGQVNVIDTLYQSCMDMFSTAKDRCADTVADMFASCKSTLGPLLSTWWCSPVAYSLEKICPWIMNQLVDDKSVCQQIRQFNVTTKSSNGGASTTATSLTPEDVNAAFAELQKQLGTLEASLQEAAGQASGGGGDGQARVQRLELSVSFNEKTRQVFLDAKQLMQVISEKYKLRRLLVDILLFLYDIYTSYTFLLIIIDAWRYRRSYLSDVKFDNCYITQAFVELDASEEPPRRVLPLTRDESQNYISTFTCRRRTKEERQLMGASFTSILVFLAFALSLLYLDNIFYSILASIQEHSLVRFRETGHHEVQVTVRGDGAIARLVRRLASGLNSAYELDRLTSTAGCLPDAQHTRSTFYWHFFGLCLVYFLIDQLAIYAMRLRRVTCAYFYPHKERERLEYLHKFIKFQRRNLELCGLKSYLDEDEDDKDSGSQTGGKSANNRWLTGEDPDDQVVAYSLREAFAYLRGCLARSSQKYCSCWRRCFFSRRHK